jgi:putative transposase
MNGKESPKSSFEKFTAHQFLKRLSASDRGELGRYAVPESDRQHRFWQRDPLAIRITGRSMAVQKLNYMHNNPLQAHWQLCDNPAAYPFSSARFYEKGIDAFCICTHFMDAF